MALRTTRQQAVHSSPKRKAARSNRAGDAKNRRDLEDHGGFL